jgi:autophagy-related protein 2
VTPENELASDECEAAMTVAPMRVILDQRAVQFAKAFFDKGEGDEGYRWAKHLHPVPDPYLRIFQVMPIKLKIDYFPQTIDTAALKNGSIVELINICPLDAMVLTLHQVEIENVVGFGEAVGNLVSHWLGDICATQIHKFLTNARPFEPITNIGGGVADLFVLPWDAYKNRASVTRAVRKSVSSLFGTLAHETLTTSSRLTAFIAGEMSRAADYSQSCAVPSHISLPSRPVTMPRHVGDTAGHALESLARGVQTANYKVIIVPYREYRRSGTTGAVKSIARGIPIAIAGPVGGASEALSYTLLGVRNQIRPDIRKEEEVCQRGLHYGSV